MVNVAGAGSLVVRLGQTPNLTLAAESASPFETYAAGPISLLVEDPVSGATLTAQPTFVGGSTAVVVISRTPAGDLQWSAFMDLLERADTMKRSESLIKVVNLLEVRGAF